MKENEEIKVKLGREKDSPVRSILKAISWRAIASGTTFIVAFVIFNRYTEKSEGEALRIARNITAIDVIAKLAFYYLHERLWTNIRWGRYWKRTYWKGRAWRKLYKKMHE